NIRKNSNPHLKAFVQNTTLHGVKYIGNGAIHWLERLFWCIVLITCSISIVIIGRMKWFQWKETLITIERANAPHHVSTLPIPALTYCSKYSIFYKIVESDDEVGFSTFGELLKSYMETIPDEVYKVADILNDGSLNDGSWNDFFKIINTQNSIGTKFKISISTLKELVMRLPHSKGASHGFIGSWVHTGLIAPVISQHSVSQPSLIGDSVQLATCSHLRKYTKTLQSKKILLFLMKLIIIMNY
ncbi:hypothetical protein LSTR_LSTR016369, partial [Laodelphax striatellus]